MNLLVQNADIITLDEQQRFLRQTDLAITAETAAALVGKLQSPVDLCRGSEPHKNARTAITARTLI